MSRIRIKFLAVFIPLLLTGCSTTWVHPTATEADFYRDKNQCLREAMQTHPPENKSYTLGGSQTNCTGYGNMINCTTTPPVRVQQADYSGISRSAYINNCLKGKGYIEQSTSSPQQIKRTSGMNGIRMDMNSKEVVEANGCSSASFINQRDEGDKKYFTYSCEGGTKKEVMCDSDGCFIN